jgi:hypothetical protein
MIVMEQILCPYKTSNGILCPHETPVKVIILYALAFRFWIGQGNIKNSDLNGYKHSVNNSYAT